MAAQLGKSKCARWDSIYGYLLFGSAWAKSSCCLRKIGVSYLATDTTVNIIKGKATTTWMHSASEQIRMGRIVLFLLFLATRSALPAVASKRGAATLYSTTTGVAIRAHARHARQRARIRPRRAPRYVSAAAKISRHSFRGPFAVGESVADSQAQVPTGAAPALSSQVEQRLPRQKPSKFASIQGVVRDGFARGGVGATVTLTNLADGSLNTVTADADGVFRLLTVVPGKYSLQVHSDSFKNVKLSELNLVAGDVLTLEVAIERETAATSLASRLPRMAGLGPPLIAETPEIATPYRELRRRFDSIPGQGVEMPEEVAPAQQVFLETPDRWRIEMPSWNRYHHGGEYPYVRKSHWWDPFNRNRLKGDEPIFGQQTFLNITATADTLAEERRVPATSNVSSAHPGSSNFFGKGEQFYLDQTFRFSFDLFHGDTSFKPVDWRIQVTPVIDVNYLNVRELGIVNIDVRNGATRLDSHVGLQEAFVEYKIHDLSPNYDFLSMRAGIQEFSSDFRGFIFVDEQPGLRFFGNLHSNRWEYNVAYFNLIEKNTNSGLNTFESRRQQVIIANWYLQDFGKPGYTTQFSIHYNKDDAGVHYDDNGFLARPAPIGDFQAHGIRAVYLGWTGNGHFGPINVNHAFYQALGADTLNPISGRAVTIDGQMAAAEISVDKDWARYKLSAFYASGDGRPRDSRASGFDAIVDDTSFAGGLFSFWNREGLRLTGTGVALTSPDSLLPSLRTDKTEGQANFVNPGIFVLNAGANFDLTPKLKALVNVNYLRFESTAPIELLLFESPIHNTIGVDYSLGFEYRPPLSENISITGGAAALSPGQGFRDIYSGKTQFSLFGNVRFQF